MAAPLGGQRYFIVFLWFGAGPADAVEPARLNARFRERRSTTGSEHEFSTTTRSSPLAVSSIPGPNCKGTTRGSAAQFGRDAPGRPEGEQMLKTTHALGT